METHMTEAGLPDLGRTGGISSVLVIRLKALGDIVLSLPIVSALRERFPEARISYLCRGDYTEALEGNTGLDEVIVLPESVPGQLMLMQRLRKRSFDVVLDLLSSPRSGLITRFTGGKIRIGMDTRRRRRYYQYLLPRAIVREGKRIKCYTLESNREIIRMLNLWGSDTGIDGQERETGNWRYGLNIGFPAAERERQWAEQFVDRHEIDRKALVGMVPAATYQSKSWPSEKFLELARILGEEHRLCVLLLWGPGEEEAADEIGRSIPGTVKAPPTGIARLGALIGTLRLLVGCDSGPKHLAVIQGIPTVTLFGPTDPHIWDPMTDRHRVLYDPVECSPCRKQECIPNRCCAEIEPRRVADEVMDVLENESAGSPIERREREGYERP
jgi:ADP-heptose:LPS heptosyltransferase